MDGRCLSLILTSSREVSQLAPLVNSSTIDRAALRMKRDGQIRSRERFATDWKRGRMRMNRVCHPSTESNAHSLELGVSVGPHFVDMGW